MLLSQSSACALPNQCTECMHEEGARILADEAWGAEKYENTECYNVIF